MFRYRIYHEGKLLEIVTFKRKISEDQARRRLIYQDNFPEDIIVEYEFGEVYEVS